MPSFTYDLATGKTIAVQYEGGTSQTRSPSGGWTVKNPSLSSKPITSGGGQTFHVINDKPVTKDAFDAHTPSEYKDAPESEKIAATPENIAKAEQQVMVLREDLSRQQVEEQVRPSPPGTKFYRDYDTPEQSEINRAQYLNLLAREQYKTSSQLDRLRSLRAERNPYPAAATQNNAMSTRPPNSSASIQQDRVTDYKKMYEQAKPHEKALLHASTLFSSKGGRYVFTAIMPNSIFEPLAGRAIKTTKDIVLERMALAEDELTVKGKPDYWKHMTANPATQVAAFYGGARAINTLATGGGSLLAKAGVSAKTINIAGKIGGSVLAGAYVVSEGKVVKGQVERGDYEEAGGRVVTDIASLTAAYMAKPSTQPASKTKAVSVSKVTDKSNNAVMTKGKAVFETKAGGKTTKSIAEYQTVTKKLPQKTMTTHGTVESVSIEKGTITTRERSLLDKLLRKPGKTKTVQYGGTSTITQPSKVTIATEGGFVAPKGTRSGRFYIKTSTGSTSKGSFLTKKVAQKGSTSMYDSVYASSKSIGGVSRGLVQDLPKAKTASAIYKTPVKTAPTKVAVAPTLSRALHEELIVPKATPTVPPSTSSIARIATTATILTPVMHSPLRVETKKKQETQGEKVVSLMPANYVQTKTKKEKEKEKDKDKVPNNQKSTFQQNYVRVVGPSAATGRVIEKTAQDQEVTPRMRQLPAQRTLRTPVQIQYEKKTVIPEQFMKTFQPQKSVQRQRPRPGIRTGRGGQPSLSVSVIPRDTRFFAPRSSGDSIFSRARAGRKKTRKKYWEVLNPVGDIFGKKKKGKW